MPKTIDYLVKQAAIVLNASTGSGSGDSSTIGAIDDPKKYPYAFLGNFALDADREVCDAFLRVPGHPFHQEFIASTGALADEAVIAISGATVYHVLSVKVDGVDARRKPVTYFKRLANDPLSRTQIGKYFDIEGGNCIRHNGTAAVCKVVRFIPGAAPQAPDQLANAQVACLLSMATPKMGTDIEMASYFTQQWALRQQMLASGRIDIPPVVAWRKMDEKVQG